MRHIIIQAFLILILCGCNQEKITLLENELQVEKEKNSLLQAQIDYLAQFEPKATIYSDEEVIRKVQDYIDFRCPEWSIKDPKIMKISDMEYEISCLSKHSEYLLYQTWKRTILRLEINFDGKYRVRVIQGGMNC
jgi:hypothetical protein